MNFLEAAELAKRTPGSHFTRGESGLFVVHLKDGRVISSPDELNRQPAGPASGAPSSVAEDTAEQLRELLRTTASLSRQLENSNTEIRQLRREVNSLKESIARIPASEWSRYEEEHRKLENQRKLEERDRIVGLARSGALSHEQLNLVADNARALGISPSDLEYIKAEIVRTRPKGISRDSLVVHATTDGQ